MNFEDRELDIILKDPKLRKKLAKLFEDVSAILDMISVKQAVYFDSGKKYYSRDEAMKTLRISSATLYRYEKSGKLIPVRIAGRVYYSVQQIEDYITEQKTL